MPFTSLRQLALLDWKECFERLSRVEEILRQDPAESIPGWILPRVTATASPSRNCDAGPAWRKKQSPSVPSNWLPKHRDAEDESECCERISHVGVYLIGEKRVY